MKFLENQSEGFLVPIEPHPAAVTWMTFDHLSGSDLGRFFKKCQKMRFVTFSQIRALPIKWSIQWKFIFWWNIESFGNHVLIDSCCYWWWYAYANIWFVWLKVKVSETTNCWKDAWWWMCRWHKDWKYIFDRAVERYYRISEFYQKHSHIHKHQNWWRNKLLRRL